MKRRAPAWSRLPDEQLLDVRLCDLGLTLRGSPVEAQLAQLLRELEARGIRLRPHFWLAEDWFTPDGVPGIAVPFWLAHPRLLRLEQRMGGEAEGSNRHWRMRILRHEAGHAVDNAWRVRRRARWRALFGRASRRYPTRYTARPASRRHVRHLGDWYAQSHPAEDFAETFATWLQPRSTWRRRHAGWPALAKLEFVDSLAAELAAAPPPVRTRERIEPLADNTRTLRQHYRERRRLRPARTLLDAPLRRAVRAGARAGAGTRGRPLAALLRAHRAALLAQLLREPGIDRYTAWQLLRIATQRARSLGLVAPVVAAATPPRPLVAALRGVARACMRGSTLRMKM